MVSGQVCGRDLVLESRSRVRSKTGFAKFNWIGFAARILAVHTIKLYIYCLMQDKVAAVTRSHMHGTGTRTGYGPGRIMEDSRYSNCEIKL